MTSAQMWVTAFRGIGVSSASILLSRSPEAIYSIAENIIIDKTLSHNFIVDYLYKGFSYPGKHNAMNI